MKAKIIKKVLLFSILLPLTIIITIFIKVSLFGNKNIDYWVSTITFLSFIIIIIIARRFNLIILKKLSLNFKETLITLLISIFLFIAFVIEKTFFSENLIHPYSIYLSFVIIILLPIVEEIFIKKIIIDNLITIGYNKIVIVILASIYFMFIHLPQIFFIHFYFGLITSFLYIKNKNLLQVILIHILYNFYVMLFNII